MTIFNHSTFWRLCGLLAILATNPSCGDDDTECSSDIDSDTDTDTDSDSDSDTSTDTDADSDTDSDTDSDSDSDSDSDFNILDIPMRWQISVMEDGIFTCEVITQLYLDRIVEIDEGENGINSILALADDPSGAAATLDESAGSGLALQGAVILLKDNIDTFDMFTTAGSLALDENLPGEDAFLVGQLRAEGSLIVGKANLSEWANMRGNASTSGWSSLGGQTLNGANPDYNPCGSSAGSGAAVAAGLVSAALGTETSGSIICPAAANGVVGFKPTIGLVSRTGIIPISHSQDTAGTLTKDVGDAARLLSVMAGPDPLDPATDSIPEEMSLDFESGLNNASLDGMRFGVPLEHLGNNAALDKLFAIELAMLEAAGAELVEVNIPTWSDYGNALWNVMIYEFKADLNAYLASHPQPGQPISLAELIQFNIDNAETVMPHFGQEVFIEAEATTDLNDPIYLNALEELEAAIWTDGLQALMESENLDAFVSPTMGPVWETNYISGDAYVSSSAGEPAAARMPHITIPMGTLDERPVGISFFAERFADAKVLEIGYAYERLQGE